MICGGLAPIKEPGVPPGNVHVQDVGAYKDWFAKETCPPAVTVVMFATKSAKRQVERSP